MTPNPKDPRFIIHCVPADASVNLRFFYDEFLRITQNADTGNGWALQPKILLLNIVPMIGMQK